MKFSLVGPGLMPIPPNGWGAIEILIWDYKLNLEKLGHQVQIVNTSDLNEALNQINSFTPDFVHIQYDDYVYLYPHIEFPCAITTHFAYLERQEMMGPYKQRVFDVFGQIKPNIFGLSKSINDVYSKFCNISGNKLFLNPNGVNINNFRISLEPKFPHKSIYLATIDHRKRQFLFQDIKSLWYAGNVRDVRFDISKNYLGEWNKEYLYDNLTDYGNLVLLSDGEAHPLVCMEAFASGLGVVVCEWGKANLDTSEEFITVISEDMINDTDYVENAIIKNREYSISHREKILKYAKQFDWMNIIEKYYMQNVNKVISNYQTNNNFTTSKASVGIF
jgi:glycosyltransferase involved in cell wall biosynthesis